jgi:hypothetical protein
MKIVKRTFAAKKHPVGSAQRGELNKDWLTSEYMPSHKYGIRNDDNGHTPFTYRTKAEALAKKSEFAMKGRFYV